MGGEAERTGCCWSRCSAIWLHLPFTFVILYAARLAIPIELYEAARIDGATRWQTFRRITLPLLMPAILVAMLFRYIFAFRLFSEVWLLTQGGPARSTEVLAVYLYLEAFRYNDFGAAAATGWLMVLASLAARRASTCAGSTARCSAALSADTAHQPMPGVPHSARRSRWRSCCSGRSGRSR